VVSPTLQAACGAVSVQGSPLDVGRGVGQGHGGRVVRLHLVPVGLVVHQRRLQLDQDLHRTHTHRDTHTHTHTHTHTPTHTHTDTHTHTLACRSTHTHTHTHTWRSKHCTYPFHY